MNRPTLDQILSRCEEREGHLIWTGGVSGTGKVPRWNQGNNNRCNARRVAYEEYHGVTLSPEQRIGTCGHHLCMSKDCLRIASRSESAHMAYSRPEVRQNHRAAIKEQGRMGRMLTPDQVRLVRSSHFSGVRLASFLGCSKELVSAIRCGHRYADVR